MYKRIRPFCTRSSFKQSGLTHVKKNISLFKNIRKIDIDMEDILSINIGTNYKDKVNFIEIRPQPSLIKENMEVQVKLDMQEFDSKAFERDGFKPFIQSANYMPYTGGEPVPLECVQWKFLLREWFFNTHNMLNGSLSMIGQNQYIQVGDNIRVDSSVLGFGPFNAGQSQQESRGVETYFLAHVESISHTFTVNPTTGARSFMTTVQFVRGIIVDDSSNPLSAKDVKDGILIGDTSGGALDQNAGSLTSANEKNLNVITTSTDLDPDIEKIRGR
jgi:hypothetical protein